MAPVVGTVAPARDRPLVVKTVGMSWQDVVAEAVVAAVRAGQGAAAAE